MSVKWSSYTKRWKNWEKGELEIYMGIINEVFIGK
jgi:hypothetical protein